MQDLNDQKADKMERLGCLFLNFLHRPNGISFKKIKEMMPLAYQGDPESARKKFWRDKADLEALGMRLEYKSEADNSPDDHLYIPAVEFHKLPEFQPEDPLSFGLVLLAAIDRAKKEKNPDLAALKSAAGKLFYNLPALPAIENNTSDRPAIIEEPVDSSVLEQIHHSMSQRLVLRIEYPGQGGFTERDIEPRGMISHRSQWAIVAYCRKAKSTRFFYPDRIKKAEILNIHFKRDPTFKLSDYSLHPLTLKIREPVTIEIEFHEDARDVVLDFLNGAGQNIDLNIETTRNSQNNAGDLFKAQFTTANPEALYSFILRNPEKITAIGPSSISQDLQNHVQAMLDNYE